MGGEAGTWIMSATAISLIAFACIFGGTFRECSSARDRRRDHLTGDTRDVVQLGIGLIATIAALVLGLLIASASSSYDNKSGQVRQLTAGIILLDRTLALYGTETRILPAPCCGAASTRWPTGFGARAAPIFRRQSPSRRATWLSRSTKQIRNSHHATEAECFAPGQSHGRHHRRGKGGSSAPVRQGEIHSHAVSRGSDFMAYHHFCDLQPFSLTATNDHPALGYSSFLPPLRSF